MRWQQKIQRSFGTVHGACQNFACMNATLGTTELVGVVRRAVRATELVNQRARYNLYALAVYMYSRTPRAPPAEHHLLTKPPLHPRFQIPATEYMKSQAPADLLDRPPLFTKAPPPLRNGRTPPEVSGRCSSAEAFEDLHKRARRIGSSSGTKGFAYHTPHLPPSHFTPPASPLGGGAGLSRSHPWGVGPARWRVWALESHPGARGLQRECFWFASVSAEAAVTTADDEAAAAVASRSATRASCNRCCSRSWACLLRYPWCSRSVSICDAGTLCRCC